MLYSRPNSSYLLFLGTNSETANDNNCQPCTNVNAGGFDLQSIGGTDGI